MCRIAGAFWALFVRKLVLIALLSGSLLAKSVAQNAAELAIIDSLFTTRDYQTAKARCDSVLASRSLSDVDRAAWLVALADATIAAEPPTSDSVVLPIYLEALQLARNTKSRELEAKVYHRLGKLYSTYHFLPPLAVDYYNRAYNIAVAESDTLMQLRVLNNLGVVFLDLESDSMAAVYLSRADSLSRLLGEGLPALQNNFGILLARNQQQQRAIDHFLQAFQLYGNRRKFYEQSAVAGNVCICYVEIGEPLLAASWAKTQLDLARRFSDSNEMAMAYHNYARIALMREDYKLALSWSDSALEAERHIRNPRLTVAVLEQRAAIYSKQQQWQEAYSLLEKKKVFEDSLQSQNIQSQMEILERVNQQHVAFLQREAELIENRLRQQRLILIVIVAALLNLFFFGLLMRRKSKRKKQIANLEAINQRVIASQRIDQLKHSSIEQEKESEIADLQELLALRTADYDELQRELHNMTLLLASKNQLFTQTIEALESLQKELKPKGQKIVGGLIQNLQDNIDLEADWEVFTKHIEAIRPEFFSTLQARCPALTPDDLRFCAYLRLNLSSKEIARMLNTAPGAVRQRKYRIRQKLNLDSHMDLNALLNSL